MINRILMELYDDYEKNEYSINNKNNIMTEVKKYGKQLYFTIFIRKNRSRDTP